MWPAKALGWAAATRMAPVLPKLGAAVWPVAKRCVGRHMAECVGCHTARCAKCHTGVCQKSHGGPGVPKVTHALGLLEAPGCRSKPRVPGVTVAAWRVTNITWPEVV